ncbi:DUF99 family protein [Haloquadratum walsbyi]|jgi:Uncharacterized conserved protein|uniref:UPF0215 protein J07HQW2_02745 n=1 Tax=Haloquadratum walsbyi J07HQW2 TaxID=1238425 RepID=U1NGL6_9EURY|nr:DUF99 family protein [Haloquadratum walsbyi]ERG96270.1 MAG: hypothetical protein J07HQW2_02745 [Haloquadratum walsbyi J07HQW2]
MTDIKPGTRALGIAESTAKGTGECTICGAVVRRDRVTDGFAFATATVGGIDATSAIQTVINDLCRPDVQYILISGVAPAWFNLIDISSLAHTAERPVIAVSYEQSAGLESALREHFAGDALEQRLTQYQELPDREQLMIAADDSADGDNGDDNTLFFRSARVDTTTTETIIRAYTPVGGRPEPVRVARLAARGARQWDQRVGTTNG